MARDTQIKIDFPDVCSSSLSTFKAFQNRLIGLDHALHTALGEHNREYLITRVSNLDWRSSEPLEMQTLTGDAGLPAVLRYGIQ
ncbi:hypothetical protein CA601_09085 [Paraburkholderia hospita]|nr:hypothetical protein CA603_31400 [Paraburkholderia hospita]OUL94114.1 hypothetical protein CA601_09085 [Paraburkholderia hospita]